MLPRNILTQRQNASLGAYIMETVSYGTTIDEEDTVVIRVMLMESGDQNVAITTAINNLIEMLGGPQRVIVEEMTTDLIRRESWTPKRLIDWFLESHIHIITKALMMSIVKDAHHNGNSLGFWVTCFAFPTFHGH
jgi:hypothetical protein